MLLAKVVPFVAIFISTVWAQFDQAKCLTGYDWNRNSLNQDPCTVGSMLDASCRDLTSYTYPPLNASQYYLPPEKNHTGDLTCDCNTVMYSIYMACSSCQGGQIYPWTMWMQECDSVYVTQYPADVAPGTAIPYWAFYNVTSLPGALWDATVAESVGDEPEATPKPVPTLSTGSNTGTNPSSTNYSNSGGSSSGGSHVGAIVGGVVGGIVFLTLVALGVFFCTRHRKQLLAQRQPPMMGYPEDDLSKPPATYGQPYPVPNVPNAPFVPYDPSDPSTYPPQSPPTSVAYTTQPPTRGIYSGVPEV